MPRPRVVDYPHAARFAPDPPTVLAGDGAIDINGGPETTLLTKGSAAAVSIAAPGVKNIGRFKTITAGSDFAHVVTFTGSTLRDGTAAGKITWTSAAFRGSSITVQAVDATTWNMVSKNLGTTA